MKSEAQKLEARNQSLLLDLRSGVRGQGSEVCRLFFVVCCLLLPGCAKIADPLPPLVNPPDTVSDVETIRLGERLQIVFSLPPQRIQSAELYRHCGNPPFTPDSAELLDRKPAGELPRYQDEDRFFLEDPSRINQACSYWLRFIDARGLSSPFSNPAETSSPAP